MNLLFEAHNSPFSSTPLSFGFDAAVKSVLIMMVGASAILLLRRASAAIRHLVWMMAICSILIVPLLCAVLPHWHVLPHWMDPLKIQREVRSSPTAHISVAPNISPIPERGLQPEVANPSTEKASQGALTQSDASINIKIPTRSTQSKIFVLFVWLFGSILCLTPTVLGVLSLWHLNKVTPRPIESEWLRLLDDSLTSLNLRRRVALLKSPRRRMPMTWGVLRPKLLLPDGADQWPIDRRRFVLQHELAHIKRWDYFTNLLTQIICALYWFNPLVWFAAKRMAAEREQACDDLVLSRGASPSDYADGILKIVSNLHCNEFTGFGAIAMARPSKLEARLGAILDPRRNRQPVTTRFVALALVLTMGIVLPVAMSRARTEKNSPVSAVSNETRYFVRLVIGEGANKLTFEGDEVTWETLGKKLENIRGFSSTVLELAVASENLTVAQLNQAQSRARQLSDQFGFAYLSYIGLQPLGSKGSKPIAVQSAPPASSAETEDAGARIDLARARLRMLEDESRRISELGPKMVELRAAQDDFRRAKELYKDRIIADAVYTNKQFQFEQLKANLRADSAETKRIFEERSKAAKLRSAEEDLKRASELLKDKIISEASYEQRKLNFELLRTNDPSARIRLQLRAAQEDFKRASELYKEKIIPDAVYKQKKLELELLEAQLRDDASGGWRESLETTENELNHAKDDLKRMMKLRASDGGTNNPATKQSGLAGALLKSDDDPGKITEIKLRLAEQELELLKIGEKEGLVRQADLLDVNRAVELLRAKLKGSEPAR